MTAIVSDVRIAEPSRFVFKPHDNGIFDVKWNPSDTLLATCSGDKTTRISCPTTGSLLNDLRGHTGTVKCAAWDPSHRDLLSTGGRDGTICIWDLRTSKRERTGDDEDLSFASPAMIIRNAHGSDSKGKGRRKKTVPLAKSVTSLLHLEGEPFRLISSGSSDGYVATIKPKIDVRSLLFAGCCYLGTYGFLHQGGKRPSRQKQSRFPPASHRHSIQPYSIIHALEDSRAFLWAPVALRDSSSP